MRFQLFVAPTQRFVAHSHPLRQLLGLVSGVWLGACADATAPLLEPDVRSFVTGAAAAALDESGHFVFSDSPASVVFTSIDRQRASDLAVALLKTFAWPDQVVGTPLGEALQRQHGANIVFEAIRPSPRVTLAENPYLEAATGAPPFLRNLFGPTFVVRLRDQAGPAVAVSVAAYASDVQIKDGKAALPMSSGNEFSAYGNPRGAGYLHPIGPERAVATVARATGALVTGIPQLLLPERHYSFVNARWRLVLARDVSFRNLSNGEIQTSSVVYVGTDLSPTGAVLSHDALFAPAMTQIDVDTASTDPLIVFRRKPGVPIVFDRIEALR